MAHLTQLFLTRSLVSYKNTIIADILVSVINSSDVFELIIVCGVYSLEAILMRTHNILSC